MCFAEAALLLCRRGRFAARRLLRAWFRCSNFSSLSVPCSFCPSCPLPPCLPALPLSFGLFSRACWTQLLDQQTVGCQRLRRCAGKSGAVFSPESFSPSSHLCSFGESGDGVLTRLSLLPPDAQINVADVDPVTGVYTKKYATYALSGFIRGHVSSLTPPLDSPFSPLQNTQR